VARELNREFECVVFWVLAHKSFYSEPEPKK